MPADEFDRLIESRFTAALDRHPAVDRIDHLVAGGAGVTVRPVGDGVYEAGIEGSAGEWYTLIFDTQPGPLNSGRSRAR